MENRTQVDLPAYVAEPFEIFVNGVLQAEGTDYEVVGSSLLFSRSLEREGQLGFWRWAVLFLGRSPDLPEARHDRRRLHTERPAERCEPRAGPVRDDHD